MMDMHHKSGFTLTELMITTALSTVILTGLIAVFIGSSRYVRDIIIEADLALRARDLRERLLFQAVPPRTSGGGTVRYGGLLSSRPNGYGGTAKLKKDGSTWVANIPKTTSYGADSTPAFGITHVTLAIDDKGLYDSSHTRSNWLMPANFPFGWKASEFADSNHKGVGFIDDLQFKYSKDTQGNKQANYRITLRYSLKGMTRVERLHIPVSGVQQRSYDDEKAFHDDSN